MPRSSRSKRRVDDVDDEEGSASPVSSKSRVRRSSLPQVKSHDAHDAEDSEDEDNDLSVAGGSHNFTFSQQIPEASQTVLPEREVERRNLDHMDQNAREKALLSLSRMILFKALNQEPIDRVKTAKDAGVSAVKISSAAYQEVASRFQNVFGFELKQTPPFMKTQKELPAKFKDRYYLVNSVQDTDDGSHSRTIHSVHTISKIEKGVLILTVALIFCKGESRADGSRHILARDLYRLMHFVDESIPEEPPAQGTARAKAGHQKQNRLQGASTSPNLDVMLEHFIQCEYLVKTKATEENYHSEQVEDGDILYSMGPRAALEVGRKQIITFCAEILGEEPDPSMLKEIEGDTEEDDAEVFMEPATLS